PHEELGSLRNARVALPRHGETLTYFVMQLSDEHRRELEQSLPRVRVVVGLSHEEAMRRAEEAHAVDAAFATPDFLRAAKNLVWVQAQSAGVERYLSPELVQNDRIVMTNMRGVHAPAIADHAFAMLLALSRDLPVHLAGRAEGRWNREGSGVLHPLA